MVKTVAYVANKGSLTPKEFLQAQVVFLQGKNVGSLIKCTYSTALTIILSCSAYSPTIIDLTEVEVNTA